jgi:hypothetical protein
VRLDKSYAEVMTISEIKDIFDAPKHCVPSDLKINDLLVNSNSIVHDRLTKPRARKASTIDDSASNSTKDRRLSGATPSHLSVSSRPMHPALGNSFVGMSFCVFESDFRSSSAQYSRSDILNMIQSHGGKILANPPCTMCIVGNMLGGGYSLSITNTMKKGMYDFVHFSYILKCIEAGQLLDIDHSFYVKLSDGKMNKLQIVVYV